MIPYHGYECHNLKSLRAITNVKDKTLSTFIENRHVLLNRCIQRFTFHEYDILSFERSSGHVGCDRQPLPWSQ